MTSVDALKLCSWVKCRNIIADDFDFTTLKDGSVGSLKQLFLVDVNSEDSADVNCRFSPAKVPVNVRRTFTTNCLALMAFLKIHVPPEHWDAIVSRVEWVLLSDVRGIPGIPDGTNLVSQMASEALVELIERDPSVRTAEGQCWMMARPVINFRHPNGDDAPAPPPAAAAA